MTIKNIKDEEDEDFYIIKTNPEHKDFFTNAKLLIKTKYDFLFSNYFTIENDNNDIKVSYLVGQSLWVILIINLTKLFEEKKLIFQIQKSASGLQTYCYHHITFEYNPYLDKFVEHYNDYGNNGKSTNETDALESILRNMDSSLLSYFEPIIHNYIDKLGD